MPLARPFRALVVAFAFVVASGPCATADAADGVVSTSLDVTGRVVTPRRLDVEQLRAMPQHDVVVASEGGATRRYRGPLLRDVIAAAQPVEEGRFDLRRSYVVARASDGYVALFSWAELFVGPSGDTTIVALALDDAPIPDREGRIVLVAGADTKSGPRHVRWLTSIDVERVAP